MTEQRHIIYDKVTGNIVNVVECDAATAQLCLPDDTYATMPDETALPDLHYVNIGNGYIMEAEELAETNCAIVMEEGVTTVALTGLPDHCRIFTPNGEAANDGPTFTWSGEITRDEVFVVDHPHYINKTFRVSYEH